MFNPRPPYFASSKVHGDMNVRGGVLTYLVVSSLALNLCYEIKGCPACPGSKESYVSRQGVEDILVINNLVYIV